MMHYQNDKSILNSDQIEVLFKDSIEQIEQIGKLIGNNQIGNMLILIGKICASLTGAGIGGRGRRKI